MTFGSNQPLLSMISYGTSCFYLLKAIGRWTEVCYNEIVQVVRRVESDAIHRFNMYTWPDVRSRCRTERMRGNRGRRLISPGLVKGTG